MSLQRSLEQQAYFRALVLRDGYSPTAPEMVQELAKLGHYVSETTCKKARRAVLCEAGRSGTINPGRQPLKASSKVSPRSDSFSENDLDAQELAEAPCLDKLTKDEQARQTARRAAEENRQWRERAAEKQDLLDALRQEFERQPVLRVSPPPIAPKGGHRPRSLVLQLSDIHAGQLFDGQGGLGGYNLELFEKRAHRLANTILALHSDLSHSGPVERLVMVYNGDLIDGRDIHPGHDHESVGMAAQLRVGPEVLAQAVMAPLAGAFRQIDVFATPGNHGRMGKKGQFDRVEDSLDLTFMDILKLRCENMSNVVWHPWDKYYAWFTLHGHTYFAAHGDAFKSWLGIPFYGADRYRNRIESLIDRKVDVLMVGHHHSPAHWTSAFSNTVMNGSWVGTGSFGAWIGLGGLPVQKMFLANDSFACATTYDVILEEKSEFLKAHPTEI